MALALILILGFVLVARRANASTYAGLSWQQVRDGGPGVLGGDAIAEAMYAIAKAEGMFHFSGSAKPQRLHNPGNLFSSSGEYIVFASDAEGWAALRDKLANIAAGGSRVYSLGMTWREFAWMYVNGTAPGGELVHSTDYPDRWAFIVANELGVQTLSPIGSFFNA